MRVVVAMSGGVDSSVAAGLLREAGHEVIGLTLQLYDCETGTSERSCCGLSGVAAARAAAGALGLPHYVIDGQASFEQQVLRPAWDDYAAGRTPNPCVRCNDALKLGLLDAQARRLGAAFVATGHHARIAHGAWPVLRRGLDREKDQSYFLFSLAAEQLRRLLLPVGERTKAEVRELARQWGLPNAARAESQDACIAQRGDLAEALRLRFGAPARPGLMRQAEGRVVGRHEGVHRFTVGQRKGLGVGLGERAYVTAIDAARGEVRLGSARALERAGLYADAVSWLIEAPPTGERAVEVQMRYRQRPVPARLVPQAHGTVEVHFERAQRAVAPGQAVVFFEGDRVLGGGWIAKAIGDDA
ncbi:MAG: tRNA 2-thiouridine(34) synthase MnmA [Proteobacteria bacterium]|nr:tRNA 2-thiouridine(34) synthase MnmA [Pseudomonadota bacterium]